MRISTQEGQLSSTSNWLGDLGSRLAVCGRLPPSTYKGEIMRPIWHPPAASRQGSKAGCADKSHRCLAYIKGAAERFPLTLLWLFSMSQKSQEDAETFLMNPEPVTARPCHSSPDPSGHYYASQGLSPFSADSFLLDTLSVELIHRSLQALFGNRFLLYTSQSPCLLPLNF